MSAPKANLYRSGGEAAGQVDLPAAVFGLKPRSHHLYRGVNAFLAAQRLGTVATKTKGLVSGGGKKPFKQKGTGNARQGSIRAPQWKGGGTVFGPQPRDFSMVLPRKMRRQALREALSARAAEGRVHVVETFGFSEPKTKRGAALLQALGAADATALVVLAAPNPVAAKSFRNLRGVTVVHGNNLNPWDVLRHSHLVVEKDVLAVLESSGKAAS